MGFVPEEILVAPNIWDQPGLLGGLGCSDWLGVFSFCANDLIGEGCGEKASAFRPSAAVNLIHRIDDRIVERAVAGCLLLVTFEKEIDFDLGSAFSRSAMASWRRLSNGFSEASACSNLR
jgi:hypothetical protein